MDIDDLRHEGSFPAIVPNAGQDRNICWVKADAGRYGELLKENFPGILFYEDFGSHNHKPERPDIRFVDRLDDTQAGARFEAIIPYRGWKPELVYYRSETDRIHPHWTWSRYLSPIITIGVPGPRVGGRRGWRSHFETETGEVENWGALSIMTSYRRQIPEEARIQAKAVRLADKMCVKTVAIAWLSYADFLAGRGKIWGGKKQLGIQHVTPAVLDWYRAAPGRAIALQVAPAGWAISYLPVEDIPEDWWDGFCRPKWAQRP